MTNKWYIIHPNGRSLLATNVSLEEAEEAFYAHWAHGATWNSANPVIKLVQVVEETVITKPVKQLWQACYTDMSKNVDHPKKIVQVVEFDTKGARDKFIRENETPEDSQYYWSVDERLAE